MSGLNVQSDQKAVSWADRPLFEPLWGERQLSDPHRRSRVVFFFEKAFEEDSSYYQEHYMPWAFINKCFERINSLNISPEKRLY